MKKTTFTILILLWIVLTYSLSNSLPIRFTKPTPEQISIYHFNKAADPLRYTYNPLQVGNKWCFSGYNEDYDVEFVPRRVTQTDFIYGIQHYLVEGSMSPMDGWQYNQGDTLMVMDEYNMDHDSTTFDLPLLCFSLIGGQYPPYNLEFINGGSIGLFNVFGQTVNVLALGYGSMSYSWAEMFGPIGMGYDFGEAYIDGCIIDGVTYGQVPNDDEIALSITEIELKSYPNPFTNELKINCKLPSNEPIKLGLYNVKGQLIDSWSEQGSTGFNNLKLKSAVLNDLPTGVYFLKVNQSNQSKTTQILKIK